jgi:4-carboxymuconolactone decarboxylase
MDKQTFERGLEIRKSVLGKEFVENAIRTADDFSRPLQELVTEYCWGAVWGREGLDKRTRSLLNLAMISCLNRPHELRLHIAGALRNGVTRGRDPGSVSTGRDLRGAFPPVSIRSARRRKCSKNSIRSRGQGEKGARGKGARGARGLRGLRGLGARG